MEIMGKPRIALVSVLKPVDDPRMYEKFAQTLSARYEVHVIGKKVISQSSTSNVQVQELSNFHRKSRGRLRAYVAIWRHLRYIRPDLLIIHATELLPLAFLFRLLSGKKVLYDIRENYALNITSQKIYPKPFNLLLGGAVRTMERLSPLFIEHFFFAEQSYADDLAFLKHRATVLQNKYRPVHPLPARSKKREVAINCVFVGTISEVYGAREAVDMAVMLQKAGFPVSLTLAGHVIEPSLGPYLSQMQASCPFITLKSGDPLLSHRELLEEMCAADFVVLSYRPHPSTERCIPTKMFECLALQIPMIVQKNPHWEALCSPYKAGIFINFDKFDPVRLFGEMNNTVFYENTDKIQPAFWEQEAPKLQQVIDNLVRKK